MRIYTQEEEERIRDRALVREWQQSGFLEDSQAKQLAEQLEVPLRRTNQFFRLLFFIFTVIIGVAFFALIVVVFDIDDRLPGAALSVAAAGILFGVASYLATRFRLYRFGVEEALAVGSVIAACLAAALLANLVEEWRYSDVPLAVALAVGALGAVVVYHRFGFVYAACGSLICASAVPFQLSLSDAVERSLAAAILAIIFEFARRKGLARQGEFVSQDYAILQAGAWAGMYLTINLHLTGSPATGAFYWWTYAMTWVLPWAALWMGIRNKTRLMLDVGIAQFLITIATNKAYWGLPRQPWDLLLFGLLLLGSALGIRQWLASGPEGRRSGYTPVRVLARDQRILSVMSSASAVLPSQAPHSQPDSSYSAPKPEFGGGRSGGAGASGSF